MLGVLTERLLVLDNINESFIDVLACSSCKLLVKKYHTILAYGWRAGGKFKLTNQDLAGGKNSTVLTSS